MATRPVPMRALPLGAVSPFDFWDYFDSIPTLDFEGHDCSAGVVSVVSEDSTGRYQYVHINSEKKKVFMVLVLDITAKTVLGHLLLDMN